nr:hypothetical protein BaRGS_029895 [Batillaria attramentaria]
MNINDLTMDQIVEFMKEQFDPKLFIVRERFKFWSNMERKPGETLQELAARIRQDAATCDFPSIQDPQDEALRQRFICSVNNEAVLKALFKVKDTELDFAKAVKIAIETEDAAKVAKETVYGSKPRPVNKVKMNNKGGRPKNHQQSNSTTSNSAKCYRLDVPVTIQDQQFTMELDTATTGNFVSVPVWKNWENRSWMTSHIDLFKEELGCLKDFELEVKFKSDAKPVFHKARPVPFALRDDLTKGYEEGIAKGVWKPVQFNDYGTPVFQFELMQKLGGGFGYTKIDLADAYNQIKLAPESQRRLALSTHRVQFYGKFIPNLATMAEPLYRLTKKANPWKKPVGLACDASNVGIGAVLFHRYPDGSERPIANVSKTLTAAERNYSQIHKEALAIIYGLRKFYQYLYGRQFILVTDHKPLTALFGPKKGTPLLAANRLARWALWLNQFDYTIEYRKTADHGNADALSRLPSGDDIDFDREESGEDTDMVCAIRVLSLQVKPSTPTSFVKSQAKIQ